MSSPQSSHSQLDLSLTPGVHTLIAPFSSLSIESHRKERIVESGTSRALKEGEFLLNDEVYVSTARVVRKRGGHYLIVFHFSNSDPLGDRHKIH